MRRTLGTSLSLVTLACFGFVGSAWASGITLQVQTDRGTTNGCTATASETLVGGLLPLVTLDPAPCISGSATYDNAANGVFDGGGLKLGVSASLVNGGLLSYARAAFTDTVTPIGGVTGPSGFVRFTFHYDGTRTCIPVTPGCPGSEVSAWIQVTQSQFFFTNPGWIRRRRCNSLPSRWIQMSIRTLTM